MQRFLITALVLVSLAGCGVNPAFVYKPSMPAGGARKLPVKLAVLAFADGTGEYTRHDSAKGGYVNLAKTGIDYGIAAFAPSQWGKACADDFAASGEFREVRFAFDRSEAANDDVIVAGTVMKADVPLPGSTEPVRFTVSLNARNGRDGQIFWEKTVSREDAAVGGYATGCGLDRQCAIDRRHAHHNDLVRGMFLEAREDLAKSLSSGSGSQGTGDMLPPGAAPSTVPAMKSVDETIEGILNAK